MPSFDERLQFANRLIKRLLNRDTPCRQIQHLAWALACSGDWQRAAVMCRTGCDMAQDNLDTYAHGVSFVIRGLIDFLQEEELWEQAAGNCEQGALLFAAESPDPSQVEQLDAKEIDYLRAQGIAWFAVGYISEAQCCDDRERHVRGLEAYLKAIAALSKTDNDLHTEAIQGFERLTKLLEQSRVQNIPATLLNAAVVNSATTFGSTDGKESTQTPIAGSLSVKAPAVGRKFRVVDPLVQSEQSSWLGIIAVITLTFMTLATFLSAFVSTGFAAGICLGTLPLLFALPIWGIGQSLLAWQIPQGHWGVISTGKIWEIRKPGLHLALRPDAIRLILPAETIETISLPYELLTSERKLSEFTVMVKYQVLNAVAVGEFFRDQIANEIPTRFIKAKDTENVLSSYLQRELEDVMFNLIPNSNYADLVQMPRKTGRSIRDALCPSARRIGLTILSCSMQSVVPSRQKAV